MKRREPRSFQSEGGEEAEDTNLPPVHPTLVEYLERAFPIKLSPRYTGQHTETAIDQAEQRGQQQVIDRLRAISTRNQE